MMNHLGCVAVALLASVLPAAAATPPTAQATVDRIYRAIPGTGFDYHKVLYAPVLRRLLDRDQASPGDGVGLIDAVPFCDCQDTAPDYRFTTSARAIAAGRVEVMVNLRNGGRTTYRIDMVRLPAGWAVADVHGPEHASLVGWLRANLPPLRPAPRASGGHA